MNARKLKKRWLRANGCEGRAGVISDFLSETLRDISENNGEELNTLITAYKQSYNFINLPIMEQLDPPIEWCLSNNWYLQLIVQVLANNDQAPTKFLFEKLGWDYESALNPASTSVSTTERFGVGDIVTGDIDEVTFLLVSRKTIPIGSIATNIRSGKQYDVVGHVGNRYELVGDNITLYRYESDILGAFRIVEYG